MKPSTLKNAIIGVFITGGALIAPVIPQDMQLEYSYQYYPSDIQEQKADIVASTSESTPVTEYPTFTDDDNNGVVSVSVFSNRKGEVVFTQIEDAKYSEMGKINGFSKNPTKTELVSFIDTLTPKAEAAISYDAATTNNTGSTPATVTYAHTVASQSDRILIVSVSNNSTTASQIASVTYNGTGMTSIRRDVGTVGSSVGTVETFYLLAPSTGTNNVVITQGATKSTFVSSGAASYYGVAQSSPIDVTDYTESLTATYTLQATTATDNTWGVAGVFSQRGITANTNVTIRSGSASGITIGDTNAAQTPAGSKSMVYNISSTPWTTWGHAIFIKPAVAASVVRESSWDDD